MERRVLEILVDKKNESGPGGFEHILLVLHKTIDAVPKGENPSFSFEITKIGGRIRFFIVIDKKFQLFFTNQVYAHYSDVEINVVGDYMEKIPSEKMQVLSVGLTKDALFPIKTFTEIQENISSKDMIDPFSSMTAALQSADKYTLNAFQITFSPIRDQEWKKGALDKIKIIQSSHPEFWKNFMMSKFYIYFQIGALPIILLGKFLRLIISSGSSQPSAPELDDTPEEEKDLKNLGSGGEERNYSFLRNKIAHVGYKTSIHLIHAGDDYIQGQLGLKELFSTLGVFSAFGLNSFRAQNFLKEQRDIEKIKNRQSISPFILNAQELAGLVHFPTSYVKTPSINWVSSRAFEPPGDLPIVDEDLGDDIVPETVFTPIGKTNFRGTNMSFGISPDDRRRHMYIIGKTGMGKSTLLENMIIDDIRKGRGVAVIDPHGDLAEKVIGFIPKARTNQAIIFDPSDTKWPIAFNMLDGVKIEHRPLVASGLVGIFKKIFGESWGPRLEHILRNTVLALLEYPNTTIMSIPLMLTSEVYRNKVVSKVKDPVVRQFWTSEFASMAPNQKVEAAGPILNKVGQFLSSSILRNVLGQAKNTFNIRWAMDNKKIVIVNLSKGKIGEDASALLGAMMVTKFQLDAMSRADIPESKREDFYLYVDEFQNFATDSFATILSEARKYKLNLVMANQYIDQMQESVKGAVFGNVGSLVSFQVGYHDASILKEVFGGDITTDDLTNMKKYSIYCKQLIDGMPSPIFSADTFSPYAIKQEIFESRYEKILKVSREKYAKDQKTVVLQINKNIEDIEKQEKEWTQKKEAFKDKKMQEKRRIQQEKIAQKKKEAEDELRKKIQGK